ncbi:MAG TPA: RDD family protein [Steroidobacteraceae bacterium]
MDEQSTTGAPAGIFRRLAAMIYDALLLLALWFSATFAMLPLTGGEAILASRQWLLGHLYHALLLLLAVAYFGLCWTRGGQTLGMKAWRIRLETLDGRSPGWGDALIRFTTGAVSVLMAVLGLWYLRTPERSFRDLAAASLLLPMLANLSWIALGGARRSLQDLAGGLRVVRS